MTNEYLVQHSSAKRTKHKRESYMVGALARFNVNFDELHPKAKSAAAAIGLKPKVTNPYLNTAAQVVEIVHCVEDAIRLCDVLLKRGITWEDPAKPARLSGEGVGACDVPRGTLFHNYVIYRRSRDGRELHHPHRSEPEQHRNRHARARADDPRPHASGDDTGTRDARSRV